MRRESGTCVCRGRCEGDGTAGATSQLYDKGQYHPQGRISQGESHSTLHLFKQNSSEEHLLRDYVFARSKCAYRHTAITSNAKH